MSKSNKVEKIDYSSMTSADIFTQVAGGELIRGGVSKTIRELHSQGYTTGQIAKLLNKRYQHVRNVLTEPSKAK